MDRRLIAKLSACLLAIFGSVFPLGTRAQDSAPPPDNFRFQPPPIDEGYDEVEEDSMEIGDDGFVPPPPPPGSTPPPPPPGPGPGFADRGGNGGSAFGSPGSQKLRFQIVEGEFWEKGKKRQRGKKQ